MSRRRIRPLLALAGGVVLAFALTACGSSGSDDVKGASDGSSAPMSASSTPSPSATAVSRCAVTDLMGAAKMLGGAAGTAYYTLQVTNEGAAACVLRGFETVALQDSRGNQIGAPARTEGHARSVVLQPGHSATRRLGIGTAVNYPTSKCKPKSAAVVAISSKASSATVTAPLKTQGCASTSVKLLTVQPFRAIH